MSNPTRIEAGRHYALAYCHSCPPWRRLSADRPEALRAAATHVELVHHDLELAKRLRKTARRAER